MAPSSSDVINISDSDDVDEDAEYVVDRSSIRRLKARVATIQELTRIRKLLEEEGFPEKTITKLLSRKLIKIHKQNHIKTPHGRSPARPRSKDQSIPVVSPKEEKERQKLYNIHERLCVKALDEFKSESGLPFTPKKSELREPEDDLTGIAWAEYQKIRAEVPTVSFQECLHICKLRMRSIEELSESPYQLFDLPGETYRRGWMKGDNHKTLLKNARKAYRRAIRLVHPDKNRHPRAILATQMVTQAFNLLVEFN